MKVNSREKAMSAFDSQPAIKIQQIDAAAQQDVLAVVDDLGVLAVADFVGRGAAAQERARFQHSDRVAGAAQRRRGCGKPSQTSANDDDISHRSGVEET